MITSDQTQEILYVITNHKFPSDNYGNDDFLNNWPMLYNLENGKKIYIGESTNVSERMKQHYNNHEKREFKQVHFIYSERFNQSATFDYESKLIQFVSADGKFIITNKNDGIANKNYFRKSDYDDTFEQLWNELISHHLADHSLEWIKNSEFYKYSPFKELNKDQKKLADEIITEIRTDKNKPVVVEGRLGTGKTKVAKTPVFFFDPDQLSGPSGTPLEIFDDKLKHRLGIKNRMSAYAKHYLKMQMRVAGGEEYINYINDILHDTCTSGQTFSNYDFKIFTKFEDFNRQLYIKEKEFELCRMLAGYAWEWKSKNDKTAYDIEIEGISKRWNHCLNNWINSEGALDEVGCIHTSAGYDLNYGFIILGKDIRYDETAKKIYVDRSSYFDKRGKQSATDEELNEYIRNIYYVLMTRGIKGTYLYVCDDALREYFLNYVERF